MKDSIEDATIIAELRAAYAPDDGAEREHNADTGGLGFGLVHYSLVRTVKPERALAVGSRYGFIPACIALGLKANGKGRLDFVDANYDDKRDGDHIAYGGVSHWSKPLEEAFARFDLHQWIDIHLERTNEFFGHCATNYQYVYLDGNHSYPLVLYDAEQSLSHLDSGGIITFHDALVDNGDFGVRDYLNDHYPHAIVLGAYPGLGVVQPKSGAESQNRSCGQAGEIVRNVLADGYEARERYLQQRLSEAATREKALRKQLTQTLAQMAERDKGPFRLRQLIRHPKAFCRELLGIQKEKDNTYSEPT